ncbi:hypothetical protein [Polynucleobacter sp. MWH-UH2A]|uniref:hypothetical protein n=1 Tax=Polynucleobacter sp. MWH-UH2A TaxID=1855617 RepID=UPI001BFE8049|nr:hypothetical protein [Polynucleobacter sp. MWH-UH2A]QWD63372.1 hypothetical protein IC571_06635 [Polynucleobacter sp. MWH-UH2A]
MPVLIEGVCVLLKKGSIIERYQGGYGQFQFDLHDHSKLSESDELISISFDHHEQAREYLKFLVQRGLKVMLLNEDNPNNTDALLVDQVFGPSFRVYWLDFIHLLPNPHSKARKNKRAKTKVGDHEEIVIATTEKELDEREEARLLRWGKDEISFPKDWEFKSSKSMDLEFMRMAENRSKLAH